MNMNMAVLREKQVFSTKAFNSSSAFRRAKRNDAFPEKRDR